MNIFRTADILLPQVESLEKWSVIACDQFTSEPEYWQDVEKTVGGAPSALRLILPEVYLQADNAARTEAINAAMTAYLRDGIFREYRDAYVYVERTLQNGAVRAGVVGAVDLEAYDYAPHATSPVRATEKTVVERIPPRKQIRENAPLELPHILLLCDDEQKRLIESVTAQKDRLPLLYDFDLMKEGGHVRGWLLQGKAARVFDGRIEAYIADSRRRHGDLCFAVGDGNHSLATAKACYEEWKATHPGADTAETPARYAMAELGNIHSEALRFEPIHRIVRGVNAAHLLGELRRSVGAESGRAVGWCAGNESGAIALQEEKGRLAVGILQPFLDDYLQKFGGTIDYIHGDEVVKRLAREENAVGFLLPAMEKGDLFDGIASDGALPRKTFSMGHAREKRYYLEARKIR